LVAQQAAQQYPMPPPPKKDRRERSERMDKERPHSEGERASGEGRPEGEHPERVGPEGDIPEPDKTEKEQPIKDKPDREKDITPAVTKKPSSKKTKSVSESVCWVVPEVFRTAPSPHLFLFSCRPKSDNHQSPPSDKQSIQSGKSATKSNKNSHISRYGVFTGKRSQVRTGGLILLIRPSLSATLVFKMFLSPCALRPKLKNIDRSTAQQLAITVGNVTVIITDFKEKTRSSSTSSSTITSSAGSEQQHQSSGSESMDKGSSRASTPKGDLSVGHDESF
ncbi:hypothetical protein XENOCAPTIV_011760, partial [Xenoophorus captivus]